MNDIQNKIAAIKAKLSSQEDGDFSYMTEDVRELRHYVMYIHGALESAMDVRIWAIPNKGYSKHYNERQGKTRLPLEIEKTG